MGYSLHIERENNPIAIEEWKKAVSEVSIARIQEAENIAVNPSTREKIQILVNEGDVEVLFKVKGLKKLFGQKASWKPSISFFDGKAFFIATEDIENNANPVHQVAAALAKKLNAVVRGDEGEEYKW